MRLTGVLQENLFKRKGFPHLVALVGTRVIGPRVQIKHLH